MTRVELYRPPESASSEASVEVVPVARCPECWGAPHEAPKQMSIHTRPSPGSAFQGFMNISCTGGRP